MARGLLSLKPFQGTEANLVTLAAAAGLIANEVLFVTDRRLWARALTTTTYEYLGLKGVANNSAAAAGDIGEILSTTVLSGSAVSLTTAVAANVTSVSLTAGDWDIQGNVGLFPAASTSITLIAQSISNTTAALDASPGRYSAQLMGAIVPGALSSAVVMPSITCRLQLNATTTIYLTTRCTFTASTLAAYGMISARRAR